MHSPRLAFACVLAFVAFAGCEKSRPAKPTRSIPPLPVVALADVPPPAETTVVLKQGMRLGQVAQAAYGHERFSGMVAAHNHIADVTRIKAGTEVELPSIPVLFQREGLDPRYQPAVNVLGWAVHEFYRLLPDYRKLPPSARQRTPEGRDFLDLPAELKASLEKVADAVEAATEQLAAAKEPHHPPQNAIRQLRQVVNDVRNLAAGRQWAYDVEMVGQRFAQGLGNLLIWVREQHQ